MNKILIGLITSDKRDKTITVAVTARETHPLYKKQYTKTRKYTAHDEKKEAKIGDKVQISAVRPISKTKSWKLDKILARGNEIITIKEEEILETEANEEVSEEKAK